MSFSPSSPLTGGPQTGFTSPTYTLVSDSAVESNARQYAVSALGGTQTGVDIHSVSRPFTLTAWKPKVFRPLGSLNPLTGVVTSVPRNVWTFKTRKGVTPLAGQASVTMQVTTTIEVAAGSDIADPANIKAALSAHFGMVWNQSAGIGDSAISGIL